ncbi:hypothetical protein [Heyndrickxia sporothermodurans]|nr:hypothetical protein [Heyndrickxia sporothermodurans]
MPERLRFGKMSMEHWSRNSLKGGLLEDERKVLPQSARKSRMREFEQDPSIAKCPKEPYAGI